jgi:site-specific DNA recombinase
MLTTLCREHHVQIFACNQPAEPVARELLDKAGTDTARLSEILFGFISEQENRTRVRRRQIGMRERARRGRFCGSTAPFGYTFDDDRQLVPDPVTAHWLRWIFEQRAAGASYEVIMNELTARGIPSPGGGHWWASTVYNITHNSTYIGHVTWGDTECADGQHEPLISRELWDRVQVINENGTSWRFGEHVHVHALTGLLRCGHCGWACGYTKATATQRHNIRCNQYAHYRSACNAGYWPAAEVEAYVLDAVQQALYAPDDWRDAQEAAQNTADVQAELDALESQIAEQERRHARWNALFEAGGITANELLTHRQRIYGQIDALSERRDALSASLADLDASRDRLASLRDALDDVANWPPERLRELYAQTIRRVVLYKHPAPRIEIDWL